MTFENRLAYESLPVGRLLYILGRISNHQIGNLTTIIHTGLPSNPFYA